MNAVAAGFGADIDHRVAEPGGGRIENLVLVCDADRHRINEDIAVIAGVEIHLAANRRDAHAVAIAADARDHAADEMAGLRVLGRAETQRVQIGDGRAPMVKTSRIMPPTPVAAP